LPVEFKKADSCAIQESAFSNFLRTLFF